MSNQRDNGSTGLLEPPVRKASRVAKGPEKAELEAIVAAIGKSQAVIEFRMDGTVETANDNFLRALGYTLKEIKGQHHSMFVDPVYARSSEYREFWTKLNRGEYQAAEYKRVGKGGKEVWIQASYNPILDPNGKPVKVIKFATDVTEQKLIVNTIARHIEKISRGEIPAKITDVYAGDFNLVKENLNACIDNIQALVADADVLVTAATAQRFDTRADASKHLGEYRKIVDGFNNTLDVVVDKLNWNQAIIDAVPFPIHVIDMDMNWVFLNKAFEKLMVEQKYIRDRKDAVGRPCSTANANICKTEKCGIMQLKRGTGESFFDWHGKGCKQDTSHLVNIKGQNVGYVEVVQDLSSTLSVKDYTAREVDRLASTLEQLAQGDLRFELKTRDADQYCQEVRRQFEKINTSLAQLKSAIESVVADTGSLTQAAVDGKLSSRADAEKHRGEYRRIVEGINQTLDAVLEPVKEASRVVEQIAGNDLRARMEGDYRGDLANFKNDVNKMATELAESFRLFAENSSNLATSADELTALSQQMACIAEETSAQAQLVSTASGEVSVNVNTVATGTEQMQTSIREISKSANEAARVAKNAVTVAHSTNETVTKLGESSQEIGKVIKVITSIAQQTNLLALNATIEAARAGEAGKGFAVVANAVKELAKQTARATEEIGQKIEAIQTDTKGAVAAIGEIGTIIDQINDISNSIASAVEEQTVTTKEIGRNVSEAARGTGDIAKNISGVAEAAKITTGGVADTEKAAAELSRMATQLQAVAGRYKV